MISDTNTVINNFGEVEFTEDTSIEQDLELIRSITSRLELFSVSTESMDEAALEGISGLLKRLIYGTMNVIVKVIKNVSTTFKGIVLPKRSVLREVQDANIVYAKKLDGTSFAIIHKAQVGSYPFKDDPSKVGKYFNETYKQFGMTTTFLQGLRKTFNEIAASIKLSDNDRLTGLIASVKRDVNSQFSKGVIDQLSKVVITAPKSTTSNIGDTFKSTKEVVIARDIIGESSDEISNFLDCRKEIKKIEKSWDGIIKALKKSDDVGIPALKNLATSIEGTATFFNHYATFSLEYHHLEMWMSKVLGGSYKKIKASL